jgi:hypothetical protein
MGLVHASSLLSHVDIYTTTSACEASSTRVAAWPWCVPDSERFTPTRPARDSAVWTVTTETSCLNSYGSHRVCFLHHATIRGSRLDTCSAAIGCWFCEWKEEWYRLPFFAGDPRNWTIHWLTSRGPRAENTKSHEKRSVSSWNPNSSTRNDLVTRNHRRIYGGRIFLPSWSLIIVIPDHRLRQPINSFGTTGL